MHTRVAAALALLTATAIGAVVRVPIGSEYEAIGRAIETSTGDRREHFAGVPYATRDEPFAMPHPVQYAEGVAKPKTRQPTSVFAGLFSRAFCDDDDASDGFERIVVNPAGGVVIAPSQGSSDLRPDMAAVVGVPLAPEDDAAACQMDIFRPPVRPGGAPLRVLVMTHGGMAEDGSRMSVFYRCDDALRSLPDDAFGESTIIVTVEYSLGGYGFWHEPGAPAGATALEHRFGAHPANLAIHQLLQALLWVQRHIHVFGGNPHDVTLAGHSAGAALAQWAHLVLTPDVAALYGFTAQPFSKLALMGGSALLFPAAPLDDVHAMQDAVVASTPCAAVPPGPARVVCLKTLPHAELRTASMAAAALWVPAIDGALVHADAATLIGGTCGDACAWSRDLRVLMTVTKKETSMFCKIHERQIAMQRHLAWAHFGQSSEVSEHVGRTDPARLHAAPFEHTVERSTEACFTHPALFVRDMYTAQGVAVQVVSLDTQIDVDVHAFAMDKLDRLCRAVLKVPLSGLGAFLAAKETAANVINRITTDIQSSVSSIWPFGSRSTESALAPKPASTRTSAMQMSARTDLPSESNSPVNARTIGASGKSLSSTGVADMETPAVPDESEGLFGIPHLTMERITRLLDPATQAAITALIEEHVRSLGTFHGLDQVILFNAAVHFKGVTLRAAEIFSPEAVMALVWPIHTFVAEGVARGWRDTPLAEPTLADAELCCRISVPSLVRTIKSRAAPTELFDVRFWLGVFDSIQPGGVPQVSLPQEDTGGDDDNSMEVTSGIDASDHADTHDTKRRAVVPVGTKRRAVVSASGTQLAQHSTDSDVGQSDPQVKSGTRKRGQKNA